MKMKDVQVKAIFKCRMCGEIEEIQMNYTKFLNYECRSDVHCHEHEDGTQGICDVIGVRHLGDDVK